MPLSSGAWDMLDSKEPTTKPVLI